VPVGPDLPAPGAAGAARADAEGTPAWADLPGPAQGAAGGPPAPAALSDAIRRASLHAPFLRRLLGREEGLLGLIAEAGFAAALERASARLDPAHPSASLRQARQGVALAVALADLSGSWALEEVTTALSRFADRALDFALAAAFAERGLAPGGLCALALGKLGSHELNFSSDIDLIFLHDPARLPAGGGDATDLAVRIVRRAVALLAERTAEGYVFRVDLRLRPDPDSTPVSLPVAAAEGYYQSEAEAWERSAFIRARPAAGDLRLGADFLEAIRPFVWRRSLDYSAIAEIREVSLRIRDHFGDRQAPGPGWDLKRGRGGIREIEFYAQAHQMLWGGRDPSLRVPATLDALLALARAGHVAAADAGRLAAAYRLFRRVEHRLQMVEDQQTHRVPRQAEACAGIAALDGSPSWRALERALVAEARAVARLYDRLIAIGDDTDARGLRLPFAPEEVARWAARARIADPALAATLVAGWRTGRARSLRAPEARRAFEAVLPRLLPAVGRGRKGRDGLLRLDRLIQALALGVQVWRLLKAHPPLVDTLARLLTATPWLADRLARHPQLLDVVLAPPPPLSGTEEAIAELEAAVRGLAPEPMLDRARVWSRERRFQLALDLLDGGKDPLEIAAGLARLAEAAVVVLARATEEAFAARHGRPSGSELVTLALGRFGGGELTFQSDLDLVFLFTGDWQASTCGDPPMTASAWWNRLVPRIVAALSVPTAEGPLYEVDTRLRPSGRDGLLAISLESFARYQKHTAEPWEIMALTRARPITGTPAARSAAAATIEAILAGPHDAGRLLASAEDLRRHMARHKPARGPFDLKLARGGLVDLEFVVQVRALLAGRPLPTDLVAMTRETAPELEPAARLLGRALIVLRLVAAAGESAGPGAQAMRTLARACGFTSGRELKSALAEARRSVNEAWRQTFGRSRRDG